MQKIKLIKQFLSPDWKRIIIFVILAFILLQFKPLGYKKYEGSIIGGKNVIMTNESVPEGFPIEWVSRNEWGSRVIYLGLFIDLLIWYFVSCFFIFSFNKMINKKSAI